jgi:hypothetical protein
MKKEAKQLMSTPITDKAEVSIDFPEKFYMGSFGADSRFDVTTDKEGVHLHLERADDEKRRAKAGLARGAGVSHPARAA